MALVLPLTSLLSLVVGGVEATEILLEGVVVAQVDIALAQEPLAAVLLLNLN